MNQRETSQCLTIRYGRIVDTLTIPCAVSKGWDPRSSLPQHDEISFDATLHTGITSSGISASVVQACGLRPTRYGTVTTPFGLVERVPIYLVNVWLQPSVAVVGLPVAEIESFRDADVVIGMDIIGRGDFAVTNADQETVVTFRFPPQGGIDFEAESMRTEGSDDERGFMTRYPIGFGRGPRRT